MGLLHAEKMGDLCKNLQFTGEQFYVRFRRTAEIGLVTMILGLVQ